MNLPRSIQYSTRILLLIIVSRLFCVPDSHAQGPPDSIPAARADSSGAASEADSASLEKKLPIPKPDSLMHALEDSAKHAGGRIRYSGETITFFPSTSVVLIQGQACVEMEGRKVEADSFIAYNRNTGEIVVGGGPEMTDGKEKIEGRRFRYNIDRDRGIVEQAQTEFGDWRLKSDSLSKVGPDSIFGRGNRFTSCDRDPEPHYHFESPKIKVIRNKTVFASPVVLKIGKVPVFVLPFVFFPITTGDRVSGILQPRVGLNSVRRDKTTGRTIGNLGYFWAPNDYVDFLGAVDIRTGSQTTLRGRSRYRKRYGFEGDFDARLVKDKINNSTSYSLFGRHRQTIGERGRLIGEVNYTSTKNLLRNTSFDLQDLLRQSLRSTASYSWRPSWGSFNSSVRHEMFLDEGASRTVMNLPSVSLSLNKRSLFKYLAKTVPRRRGVVSTGWLYNITYGVSTDYSNTRTAREGNDTRTVHRSNTRFSLDSPQVLYGWLKVNPGLSYSARLQHDNLDLGEKFSREQTLNLSTSVSTQIFGMFDGPRLGPIFRWRHSIRPRLSYSFQPDLTGENPSRRVNRVNFTVSNDVEYKYYLNDKETEKGQKAEARGEGGDAGETGGEGRGGKGASEPRVKKGKLFSLRNSLSYDFNRAARRDTLGWGSLSTSLTSAPASFLNIQLLMNHDLVERGMVEHLKPFMSRLSTTVTLRGTYKARKGDPSTAQLEEEAYFESQRYPSTIRGAFGSRGPMGGYDTRRDLAFSRAMPWSVNLSHNLSRRRNDPTSTQSLRWSITFNPSSNWHLVYSSSYNFSGHGLQGQTFILNRDLHCWQANMSFITLPGGRFEFVFSTYLRSNPSIRVPDVRRASN